MRGFWRRPAGSLAIPAHGLTFIGLALLTSFFAYLWGATSPNPSELLAPALFWYALCFLLVSYPLREAWLEFRAAINTALGATSFSVYMAIHVVLYGFLLESILVSFFDKPLVSASTSAYVTTAVFAPPSLSNAVLALWFNPWITLTVPPVFDDALSFYSLAVAVLIGILIVANISKVLQLGSKCSANMKSRAVVLLPAMGVFLGASCCLTVPLLVTIAAPSAPVLSSILWVYDATYFFFPPFAVVLLYLNLRSVGRISSMLSEAQGAAS